MKQLGLGLLQYAQDYDEQLPSGNSGIGCWGWAGPIFPYVKSAQVFVCPSDANGGTTTNGLTPVSYGLNLNLTGCSSNGATASLSALAAPARTVWLFELGGKIDTANNGNSNASIVNFSALPEPAGVFMSRSNNGFDGGGSGLVVYSTGTLDTSSLLSGFNVSKDSVARHFEGANYLASDGHVKWLLPSKISAGRNNTEADGSQNNFSPKARAPAPPRTRSLSAANKRLSSQDEEKGFGPSFNPSKNCLISPNNDLVLRKNDPIRRENHPILRKNDPVLRENYPVQGKN